MTSLDAVRISCSESKQNDEGQGIDEEDDGSKMEKVIEKKKFTEVIMLIYFGTEEEKMDLIFSM
jgi:hypothetical protein